MTKAIYGREYFGLCFQRDETIMEGSWEITESELGLRLVYMLASEPAPSKGQPVPGVLISEPMGDILIQTTTSHSQAPEARGRYYNAKGV